MSKAASKLKSRRKPSVARRGSSTAAKSNVPIRSITPHLVCAGAAKAIAFYKKAFGAVEVMRMPGPGGTIMHAQISIGDSIVFLVDENREWDAKGPLLLGGSPVTIHLMVENADAVFEKATKAGAKVLMPLADQFWGDRYGVLQDPFGHSWSVAHHVRDMTPKQMQAAMKEAFGG